MWLALLVVLLALDGFDAAIGAPTFNPLHPRAAHWVNPRTPAPVQLRRVCPYKGLGCYFVARR